MKAQTLLSLVALGALCSCAGQSSTVSQTGSTSSIGSNASAQTAAAPSLVGFWMEMSSNTQAIIINADGTGRICSVDEKSNANFTLNGNTMGPYGHGEGDLLSLGENGTRLVRAGQDHGEPYEVIYYRVADVPSLCD